MCLAVPGRIVEIRSEGAQVDFAGVEKIVLLDLVPDARVGDYVLVHAGFAIQQLDAVEAREIIGLFDELENAMRDEDSETRS